MKTNKSVRNLVLFAVGVVLILLARTATADDTVHIPVSTDPADQQYVLPAPGPGENLTVVVEVPVDDTHKVVETPTYVTNLGDTTVVHKGTSVRLRGGLTTGMMIMGGLINPSVTAGLIGEIGHKKSAWSLQGAFRAGMCEDGVALDSSLAAMGRMSKNLRAGLGADLLYCSDVSSHPKEMAKTRLVGGSFRLEVNVGPFAFTGSIGAGAFTMPIPEDRITQATVYGGATLSYMWGK